MTRWLVRLMALTGALAGMAVSLPAVTSPAKADSFRLSFSSGGYGHGYGHRRHHHHHYRPHHYGYRYYGPPVVYAPPPVYYAPPPPRVVYVPPSPAYAPTYSAMPTVTGTAPAYRTADGRYCREYQSSVSVGGGMQPSYGTACLEPDGSWRIVD